MQLLDTQVISYSLKGVYTGQVNQQLISSLTAKEFLLIQGSDRKPANYYVPLPRSLKDFSPQYPFFPRMKHPFSKRSTDRIVLDFGQDYSSIVEFSNYAIAEVINLKAKSLFRETTRFLNKDQKKLILRRFRFLLNSEVRCIPLTKNILERGMVLFYEFMSNYNAKSDIKNTINDVLILATAIELSAKLITKDSLLNRFASEYFDTCLQKQEGLITLDFGPRRVGNSSKSRESKEYINRGWKVRMLNHTGAW